MQIEEYLSAVRDQVVAAAALGDDQTRQVAQNLAAAITPAVRLAIMGALSAAAEETTAALLDTPGSPGVSLRLDGSEIHVDVHLNETSPVTAPDESDANARITLRLPDALKADVEAAARLEGTSVNSWFVRAAATALSSPGGTRARGGSGAASRNLSNSSHRLTGWINS